MNEDQSLPNPSKHSIWLRLIIMLLMGLAYQLTGTMVLIVTVIQFVVRLVNGTPNTQLVKFGRSLGRYLQQIVNFLTFSSEEIPFPFSDWPSDQ